MQIPVKDEAREGDPCPICRAVKGALDRLLTELPQREGSIGASSHEDDLEHVMTSVARWFVQQAIAHTDGDIAKVIQILQGCLNEPQNNRLVAKHLEEVQLAYSSPDGPVH